MFEESLPYAVCDADNHFFDAPDSVTRHLETKYKDKVAQDRRMDLNPNDVSSQPGGLLGRMNPYKDLGPKEREDLVQSFRSLEPAYQDRDRRLEVMDAQGVEAVLMFPTWVGLSLHSAFPDDPEATIANVRSYNRWIQDDWGFAYKERIFVPAAISLLDLELGLAELERVLEEGARTVLLPPGPLHGRSPADPHYDPFWARLNEAGANVAIHLNYTDYQRQGGNWGYDANAHYFDGFDAFQWFAYWGDRPIMETVAAMIFHNLFGRFPNVHVGILEQGTVWLPYALRKLDHAFMLGKPAKHGKLDARPHEIFQQHFIVAPYPEENVTPVVQSIGTDCLVFGSDFPHAEGLADPVSYIEQLGGLSEPQQKAVMRDNLARFLGLAV